MKFFELNRLVNVLEKIGVVRYLKINKDHKEGTKIDIVYYPVEEISIMVRKYTIVVETPYSYEVFPRTNFEKIKNFIKKEMEPS